MHDLLPDETGYWQFIEDQAREVLAAYGYREIRLPIVEKTELFKRSIGEVTDIVEKEMYTFEDRSGDLLTLRPEGTAGCVRAGIQHGFVNNQVQRLWYAGPMFRHERPQKGRYRQFHQIGVEVFGLAGPDVDAEHILMTRRLWGRLGLEDAVRLEINTLGSLEARQRYRDQLVAFLEQHQDRLDDDSRQRLHRNPLRILDSKNPDVQALIQEAPSLYDHLDEESREHFEGLKAYLDEAGVGYTVNPRLVRGLDYYGKTVFEWVTDRLGAQGTVCAGGRFDALVEYLGGRATPAAGMAMGLERLVALLQDEGRALPAEAVDCYLVMAGEQAERRGRVLAESLRDAIPQLRLVVNCDAGSFKAQMRRADRSGARWALILGDDEVARNIIAVKPLRAEGEQEQVAQTELAEHLRRLLA